MYFQQRYLPYEDQSANSSTLATSYHDLVVKLKSVSQFGTWAVYCFGTTLQVYIYGGILNIVVSCLFMLHTFLTAASTCNKSDYIQFSFQFITVEPHLLFLFIYFFFSSYSGPLMVPVSWPTVQTTFSVCTTSLQRFTAITGTCFLRWWAHIQ